MWSIHALKSSLKCDCVFQAKGKERQWLKNQALGELDDAKIIDGLTGEKTIYKRRGELDPEVCVCVCVFKPCWTFYFIQTHNRSLTHIIETFICETVHSSGV